MALQTLEQLKAWFVTGAKPTQQQFHDWLDSFVHATQGITMDDVEGLIDALRAKAEQAELRLLINLLKPYAIRLSTNGSYVLAAGMIMYRMIITPVGESNITVSLTPGGGEIHQGDAEDPIAANADSVVNTDLIARADTTVYFENITHFTTILIYTDTLTQSNPFANE